MGLIVISDHFLKLLSSVCIIKILFVVEMAWSSFCKSSYERKIWKLIECL